ncbi:hypothetical protein M405DRAFT_558080 [Rhizopogon salebrosus TDB-379]|nr:hypothetical protein M405DRAFT_558080 [Rhizopogon salebrosus TDB-379]
MTLWVRRTLVAYLFNTSCRIPGVGLSNSAVVEHSIPACTSRPAAARTMPKMSGIHASPTVLLGTAMQRRTRICWISLVGSIPSRGKVLARSCLGLLPVYELPSSKYHCHLATTVANLAKLTPERPALIRHDDDRQAPESGLNNLSVQCQRASKAVAAMFITSSPVPL